MKNIYRCTCQSVPVAESERTEEEGCERKRSKRGKQYNLFNFMKSIQNNLFGFDKNRNNKNGVLWSQTRMRIEMRLRCFLVI